MGPSLNLRPDQTMRQKTQSNAKGTLSEPTIGHGALWVGHMTGSLLAQC